MSLTFDRRVTVFDASNGMVLDELTRSAAERAYAAGRIAPYLERKGQIIGVSRLRLTMELDAKPGSFGIDREGLDNGFIIFKHKETWGKVLATA